MPVLVYHVLERGNEPRKLIWLVDTLERLTEFPSRVRRKLGFALYQAQIGQQHESAEMLRGLAEALWQVRADDLSGTLHAFQKKSTSGIATPQRELDLIRQRLRLARKLAGK
jgi:phage-related protein